MNENITPHDPIWKLLLVTVSAMVMEHVLPWTYHLASTLSTALASYFLFNLIRNWVTVKAETRPWLHKFLFKK